MAFNASAFGAKPAASTTGTSLFGAPKPAGASLFGQSQQQGQTQPSLFGQQQQPASGPGLFGQPAQQQQQQPTGNLFGQPAQQQQAGGSLFGQPQQQQQPAAGGSLFGQPAQQQQQPAAGGGLFGQPQQQQQQPTSLFGQPAQQQQQQPNATSNLFGQPAQQQQQQQQVTNPFGGSLFGSTNQNNAQQPQPQQGGIFGSGNPLQAQATIPAGGFGSTLGQPTNSLFGQKPQQAQLGVSSQSGAPLFTKTTKFNDLPDEIKRMLENIDSHIQGRVQIGKELQQMKLGDEPSKGQDLVRSVHKELVHASSVTHSDLLYARDLKAKADQAVQDTIIATRIIDGFKNPQQNGNYLKNHATFPLEFFSRITEEMKERLLWYKATIEQIERKLSSSASQVQHTPQAISATLQAQHATFIALASKTAALDSELQKIKQLYTQLWRSKTGSMRDPFNDSDKSGDLGFSSLGVK